MKLKIRQPDLSYSIEIKQLPSKQVFLFTLKQQSKNFLIPVKTLLLPVLLEEFIVPNIPDSWTNPSSNFQINEYYIRRNTELETFFNSRLSNAVEKSISDTFIPPVPV